jgi:hypothetical protein
LILSSHPDVHGLSLALADWSAELRILEGQQREKPPKLNPAALGGKYELLQLLIE